MHLAVPCDTEEQLKALMTLTLPLYNIGFVQTVAVIGPIFGYLLGALCAKIYVDFGYVDLGEYNVLQAPS